MRYFIKTLLLFLCLLFLNLPTQAEEVLIVTWRGKTDAEKGFEAKLKKLRPNIKFSYIDAGRKKKYLDARLQVKNLSQVDLVYSFGTTGSLIVKKHLKGRVPQVFNIVSAPVKAGIVKSLTNPDNNVTGAKLLVDIGIQLDILLKLKKIKTLGVWFDPRERQGQAVLTFISRFAEKKGIKLIPQRIIPDTKQKIFESMMSKALKKTDQMDALYIVPTSSFFHIKKDYFPKLKKSLLVMGGVDGYVGVGATVALAADYTERGEAVAKLANKILSGTPPHEIPVDQVRSNAVYLYVDKKRIQAIGLRKKVYDLGLKTIER